MLFRIASLPSELPKIDFEAYKKQHADPKIIDKLEKGVSDHTIIVLYSANIW